jgi:hypothetical protein
MPSRSRPRQPVPPPEKLTVADIIHIIFAFLMIPLGLMILYRTLTTIKSVTGWLVGAAFLAFGVYRLYMAYTRYKMLSRDQTKT